MYFGIVDDVDVDVDENIADEPLGIIVDDDDFPAAPAAAVDEYIPEDMFSTCCLDFRISIGVQKSPEHTSAIIPLII